MARFQPGSIVVTCETRVRGEKMDKLIKGFGLHYQNTCVNGEIYFIQVPEGQEDHWLKVFKSIDGVIGLSRVPDYRHT